MSQVDSAVGRLVLLSTTHRVAPGLLSWPAWSTLHAADAVLVRDLHHPSVPALEAAGVTVRPIGPDAARDDRALAGDLVRRAGGSCVVWLLGPDGDAALASALTAELLAGAADGTAPEVEVLPGSFDLPGARLLDLVAVMDRLRSPGGCPWDAEQTHATLLRYLLEEAYETVDAVEAGDRDAIREELGDVLLQVVFHARVAQEDPEDPFDIDDVAGAIVDKLVSRHPHVFGADAGASADDDDDARRTPLDVAQVEASWEVLKAAEKGRTSALDGVPAGQPALALAEKYLARVSRTALAVELPAPAELPADAQALGEALMALVSAARVRGLDAEGALRAACRDLAARVRRAETDAS